MVQYQPDIYILASLLLPYFFARSSPMLIPNVIIESLGGDIMDNSFLHSKKLLLVDDEPEIVDLYTEVEF